MATWEEFQSGVLNWFGSLGIGSPSTQLLVLRQEGSVADYRDRFLLFSAPNLALPGVIERGNRRCTTWALVNFHPSAGLDATMTFIGTTIQFDDLESEEAHNTNKQLSSSSSSSSPKISLNSLMGFTSAKTLKLQGWLGNRSFVVLIDCEASHSFISSHLVSEMQLQVVSTHGVGVQGLCKGVELRIQVHWVVKDFLPFDLGCIDVVLGVSWLQKLGNVQANWKLFMMKFQVGDYWMNWQGHPSLSCYPISLKAMHRTIEGEGQGFC
ncbi:hypothetical protein UlMin_017402 [Ulmus minor]